MVRQRAVLRQMVVLIDDHVAQAATGTDLNVLSHDATRQMRPFPDMHALPEHRLLNLEGSRNRGQAPEVSEEPFGVGRVQRNQRAADRPLVIGEREPGRIAKSVHVRGEVGIHRADIAPVVGIAIAGRPFRLLGGEVVCQQATRPHQRRQEVSTEIRFPAGMRGVEGLQQDSRRKQVVAHGREGVGGAPRHPGRLGRFFREASNPTAFIRVDQPESARIRERHGQRRHRDVRFPGNVELDHLTHVHPVDMIGAEHRDDIRHEIHDQFAIAKNGISRTGVGRHATDPADDRIDVRP